MRFTLLFSLLAASCGATQQQDSKTQIVGGTLAENKPYFAGLVQPGSNFTFCNGTFIDAKTVLTAAHCIKPYGKRIQIKAGYKNNAIMDYDRLEVESATYHPQYNDRTMEYDIAIVKLKDYDPATLKNKIEPIAYNVDDNFANYDWTGNITLLGTGATSSSGVGAGSILRTVKVPYLKTETCRALYAAASGRPKIFDSNLCAADIVSGGIDSCQGDSGGPAIVESETGATLVGVVSWGIGCADKKYPGVYTRVSSYSTWIASFLPAPQVVTQ